MKPRRPEVSDTAKTYLRQETKTPAFGSKAGGRIQCVTYGKRRNARMQFRIKNRARWYYLASLAIRCARRDTLRLALFL